MVVKLNYLDTFSKTTKIPSLIKIRPAGGELFHTDGEMDRYADTHTEMTT